MISKILVPTDGSKTAGKAAVYAVELAGQLNASIIAISIIDKRMFLSPAASSAKVTGDTTKSVQDYLAAAARSYAQEIKKLCDQAGVASRVVIRMGYPVTEIVKAARRSKADVIVMGSHGRSALSATVLGSVAYGVVHDKECIPVLIVRGCSDPSGQ